MPFDWWEYIRIGDFLKTYTGAAFTGQCGARSTASRAYFTAYNVARQYAQARSFQPLEAADDHAALRGFFDGINKRDVSSDLNKLRQWRNQADYDDDVSSVEQLRNAALSCAKSLIKRLGAAPPAPGAAPGPPHPPTPPPSTS